MLVAVVLGVTITCGLIGWYRSNEEMGGSGGLEYIAGVGEAGIGE